jgi:NAD(P)-dependent dehydrogenase (short-subunit alcohol dehydrogenase family)
MNILIVGSNGIIGTEMVNKLGKVDDNFLYLVDKASVLLASNAKGFEFDCLDEDAVKSFCSDMALNRIFFDQVIINAGGASVSYIDYVAPIEELGYQEWQKIISGNLDIGFLFCKYLLSFNLIRKESSVTFTSTIHSIIGPRFETYDGCEYNGIQMNSSVAYTAAKSAINGLVKYLSSYLGPRHIRVNAVLPGGIFSGQSEVFVAQYSKHVPLGRMATAKEVADTILVVASPKMSYVNGQLIVVDGGKSSW